MPDRQYALGAPQRLRCEYLHNPVGMGEIKPRLFWQLCDSRRGARQTAYQIQVASKVQDFGEAARQLWDSGKVVSDINTHVEYGGPSLSSRQRCYWRVRTWDADGQFSPWSVAHFWEMGLLDPDDWSAQWIGPADDGDAAQDRWAPHLRKSFCLRSGVRSVRLYASAMGIYEIYINGQRISVDLFRPGWTDYYKVIQFQTYDVTDLICDGDNVVGAILGDGWCCGYLGWGGDRQLYGRRPRLLAQLEIEYEDGSRQTIVTDVSWRMSAGPIVESDFYMGEIYDARRDLGAWSEKGFDDTHWTAANVCVAPAAYLIPSAAPAVRAMEEIKPISLQRLPSGAYIYDMGQNMVGRLRLKILGAAGTVITLRHAEVLNPDGTLYIENLRGAKATDQYTLCGNSAGEVYEPRFTFHGFRYVEMSGYPGEPPLDALIGVVLHTQMERTGSLSCSRPMVEQLFRNVMWCQRGNFLELPTDCPQRTERLGWTGDIQVFSPTACFNMDSAAFLTRWLLDLVEAQRPNGAFPDTAPDVLKWLKVLQGEKAGNAAWGDAGVVVPWVLYLFYGDKGVLERHHPSMMQWIEYLKANSDELVRPVTGYGDWLSIKADTPKDLLATAYFAYSTALTARISEILDKWGDARRLHKVFEAVKEAFNKRFIDEEGRCTEQTQTAYLLALEFGLLPEELQAAAADHLVADIQSRDWHLSTGFVGARYLLPVLTRFGYHDVACHLLLNETFPSWGYSIRHGATTIWEHWDGWTQENGFKDPKMNSFNHYAFGAVGQWLYESLAGIAPDPSAPGFRRIIIHPHPNERFTSASAKYESIHGKIISDWRVEGGRFNLRVVIPPNCRALLHLPTTAPGTVTESGQATMNIPDIEFGGAVGDSTLFEIGAGEYHFACPWTDDSLNRA